MFTKKPIAKLLKECLKGQNKKIIILFLTVIAFNILELIFPKILQVYIDLLKDQKANFFGIQLTAPSIAVKSFLWLGIALIVIGLMRWGITLFRIILQTTVAQNSLVKIRADIYKKVHQLNFSFHDKFHSGNLISNIVEDLRFINQFLETGLFPLIETSFYILMANAYLFYISPYIGLASILIQIIGLLISFYVLKKSFPILLKTKEYFSDMVEDFTENMEGRLVTISMGVNKQQKDKHYQKIESMHKSFGKEIIYITSFHQINVWAAYLNIFLGVSLALYFYRAGHNLSIGTIFLIFFILNSLVPRIRVLTRALDLLTRSIVTAERLEVLFSSQQTLPDTGNKNYPNQANLELKNVCFSYIPNKNVLRNISLKVEHGSLIGIVGYTGSGKSILLSLIARFYEPSSGNIYINEHDISMYPIETIRNKISLVFQETFLYSSSIKNNIAFGAPETSLDKIIEVAKIAYIHDFIMSLPKGYETEIGERGVSLSGGQKQRMGIARALLMKPDILLLDDCTSALDSHTEKMVISNIYQARKNSTTIFTTQRITSLKEVDKIFVIKEGNIIEQGTLSELNQKGTFFFDIFKPSAEEAV